MKLIYYSATYEATNFTDSDEVLYMEYIGRNLKDTILWSMQYRRSLNHLFTKQHVFFESLFVGKSNKCYRSNEWNQAYTNHAMAEYQSDSQSNVKIGLH